MVSAGLAADSIARSINPQLAQFDAVESAKLLTKERLNHRHTCDEFVKLVLRDAENRCIAETLDSNGDGATEEKKQNVFFLPA